jgi:hypothetical protein
MGDDGDKDGFWVDQPSSEKYVRLIKKLLNSKLAAGRGEIGDLRASEIALIEVIKYLHSDPGVVKHGIASPLGKLVRALHDLLRGAKPPLLFDRKSDKHKGAPAETARAILRAQVNHATDALLAAQISIDEASKWLSKELSEQAVTETRGTRISATNIKRWHKSDSHRVEY